MLCPASHPWWPGMPRCAQGPYYWSSLLHPAGPLLAADEGAEYLHFLVPYEHEDKLPMLFTYLKARSLLFSVVSPCWVVVLCTCPCVCAWGGWGVGGGGMGPNLYVRAHWA